MLQQSYHFQIPEGIRLKQILDLKDEIAFYLGVDYVDIKKNGNPRHFTMEMGRGHAKKSLYDALDKCIESSENELLLIPGYDNKGNEFPINLLNAPHLLIGGTTNSGKSSLLHNLIISLISRYDSKQLNLTMIDPKQVELSIYQDLPHLYAPVAHDINEITLLIEQMIELMEHRYSILVNNGHRTLLDYNQNHETIPFQVIVIDEYADLVFQNQDIERLVSRLAQKGRAAGIHLIIATQRPSADIVTPVLKANIPVRIALKVASMENSRVIIGKVGAENLTEQGEMLITGTNEGIKRLHGYYVSETDLQDIRRFYK